jgi:hypothetical protein
MPYNADKYDLAGSFNRGALGSRRVRRAKQMERAIDQELAREQEGMVGRRADMRKHNRIFGMEDLDFGDFQTNSDPIFQRMGSWFKNRRANRVEADKPAPTAASQAGGVEAQMQQQESDMLAESYAPETGPPQYANGGRAIPSTSPSVNSYANGGMAIPGVLTEDVTRRPPATNAIPAMADGGAVPELAGEVPRTEAERLARYRAARDERGLSPKQIAERNPGRTPSRISRAGSAIKSGGAGLAAAATAKSAYDSYGTGTEEYRERYGIPESPNDGLRRVIDDIGVRAKGVMQDVGNTLTGGYFEEGAAPPTAIPPELSSDIPQVTEDEVVAQESIAEGTEMAAEVEEANKPPGDIDFSKVDFQSGDFPSMGVKDWIQYRGETVRNRMAQGISEEEAHDEVTRMQQKGFVNYLTQGQMHLATGNAPAAAGAIRMAYQYFPNGSDIKIGVHQDPNTGQPVLLGMGKDDESGEPVGQPMYMDQEKLSVMIENFSNPDAFRMWTKDWRDDQFKRQEYEEVTKPAAQSDAQYRDRLGQAALGRADAAQAAAAGSGTGGRKQTDYDRAASAFTEATDMGAIKDPDTARYMNSIMSQIYRKSDWEYNQVIDFVMQAESEGRLEDIAGQLGIE